MVQVNFLTIFIALFFFALLYTLYSEHSFKSNMFEKLVGADNLDSQTTQADFGHSGTTFDSGRTAKSEVVYTQSYYPWWRSTRWWNYDGWLYQKPYYNYWRRPYYYNYWRSGQPLIVGDKKYYRRNYW